jgi:tyrosinase
MFAPCISPVVEGRGGGCVETGPYVGYLANLSSVDTWFDYPNVVPGEFLGYQPRCIRRDILPEFSQKWSTEAHLLLLYTNSSLDTIGPWQDALQAGTGLHSVGHFIFGGDPGGDVSLPAFPSLRCVPRLYARQYPMFPLFSKPWTSVNYYRTPQ